MNTNNLDYLLFSSYYNFIIQFEYLNEFIYPPNEDYKNSRVKDFEEIINTTIQKAKTGIIPVRPALKKQSTAQQERETA